MVTKTQHDGRVKKFAGHKEVVGNRIADNFFGLFVRQQNQYLLSYGVTLDDKAQGKLGFDFDTAMMNAG